MPNIDEIEYPDSLDDLLKHKKLGPMFRGFLDQRFASENYRFLDATHRRLDPKTLYPTFIRQPELSEDEMVEMALAAGRGELPVRGSEINIPSEIHTAMDKLAAAKNWETSKWQKHIKAARIHIYGLVELNHRSIFFETTEFKTYHEKRVSQGSDDTPFSGNDIMEMLEGLGLPKEPLTTAWLKQIADNIQAGALAEVERNVNTLVAHTMAETQSSNKKPRSDELYEKIMTIAMTAENLMDGNENLPGNNPNPSKTVDGYVEKVAAALKSNGKKEAVRVAMQVALAKRAEGNLPESENQIAKDLLIRAKAFNTAMDKYERKDVLKPGKDGKPPAGYKKQLQSISFMLANGEPEDAGAAAKELAENLRVFSEEYAYINEAAILKLAEKQQNRAVENHEAIKGQRARDQNERDVGAIAKIWEDERMMAAQKEFLKQYSDKANGRPKRALAHALSVARKIGSELGFSGALNAKIVLDNLLFGHDGPAAVKGRDAALRKIDEIVATAEKAEDDSGTVVPIDEDGVDAKAKVVPQRMDTMANVGLQTRFKASSEVGGTASGGQIEYDMTTLKKVDWDAVVDLYSIASDESDAAKNVAKLIIKKGKDSPDVMKSSKALLTRSRKRVKVAKVKNPHHLASAIEDALIKKAAKTRLTKPLKFTSISNDENE